MNHIHDVSVWTYEELARPYLLQKIHLRRDCFPVLRKHMNSKPAGRILALSGLRITGKTILLLQAVAQLPDTEIERTVFIPHCTRQQNLLDVLAWCRDKGIARVIVDAVTDMEDFTGVAPLLPYARDMLITIAGADTLYFRLETEPNLDVLDMTHIPAREYMRLQNATLQQCVQLGGMLRKPEAWPEAPAVKPGMHTGRAAASRPLSAEAWSGSHVCGNGPPWKIRYCSRRAAVNAYFRM